MNTSNTTANQKPVISKRSGLVKVSVWKNTNDDKTYYNTQIEVSFKNNDGEYEKTSVINEQQVPVVASLLNAVFAEIQLLK